MKTSLNDSKTGLDFGPELPLPLDAQELCSLFLNMLSLGASNLWTLSIVLC